MRIEAEEAERRAREKAEDDRRQRQFAADKLDALKSMKGADFDGGRGELQLKGADDPIPMKGGTATFGVKPNPGGSSPTKSSGEATKESRFSKGTQFSAPVDLTTKDPAGPLTVDSPDARELIADGHLGKFLATRDWPPQIKAQTAIAFDDLERGRPARAAEALSSASKARPNDDFLKKAATRSAIAAKSAPMKFDPERLGRELSREAFAAYVVGWEYLQQGNMNDAARMFGRALDASPKNATLQTLVSETEKRRRTLSPTEQRIEDERRQRARDYAQGNAALRLGLNAITWNNALALNYLDEASRNLTGLDWEFIRLTKQQVADRSHTDPGSYWKYRYSNRGEAILDALEYGKGDWSASLRYLKHVSQIQHKNPVVEAAYRELESLSRDAERP